MPRTDEHHDEKPQFVTKTSHSAMLLGIPLGVGGLLSVAALRAGVPGMFLLALAVMVFGVMANFAYTLFWPKPTLRVHKEELLLVHRGETIGRVPFDNVEGIEKVKGRGDWWFMSERDVVIDVEFYMIDSRDDETYWPGIPSRARVKRVCIGRHWASGADKVYFAALKAWEKFHGTADAGLLPGEDEPPMKNMPPPLPGKKAPPVPPAEKNPFDFG